MQRQFYKNKTALITGAAKRIGEGIALHLASLGYNIALHYHRSFSLAKRVAKEINSLGVICEEFPCDLSRERQTDSLIPKVIKKFPNLVLLINNASLFEKSKLLEEKLTIFNQHFAINLKAPYILTKQFAQRCSAGQIINVLDTHIAKNTTAHFSYLLSKKSLADLTLLAAKQLAPHIRVNAIAPGPILPPVHENANYLKHLAKTIPLQRNGDIRNINQAIQFLIENDYMTGQIIFVDGGEHLK